MKNKFLRFFNIKHKRYFMLFYVGGIPNGMTYRMSVMDIYGKKPFLNQIETYSKLKEINPDCEWLVITNYKELSKKDWEDYSEKR